MHSDNRTHSSKNAESRRDVEGEIMNALASSIARTRRLTGLPALWLERIAMRERLGAMPERLLADVGLDPVAVAREVRRPLWRPLGERLAPGAPPVRVRERSRHAAGHAGVAAAGGAARRRNLSDAVLNPGASRPEAPACARPMAAGHGSGNWPCPGGIASARQAAPRGRVTWASQMAGSLGGSGCRTKDGPAGRG